MKERKDQNINVRLEPELKKRADEVARACGTNPSTLMRLLLDRFVKHAEENGGRVVMPPEFQHYDVPQSVLMVAEKLAKYKGKGQPDRKGEE